MNGKWVVKVKVTEHNAERVPSTLHNGVNFNKMRSYQAFVEFPFACGIQVGTQVRVRGVKVGNVLSVRPSLERVEAGAVQLL